MLDSKVAVIAGALVVVLVAAPGCVSKKTFRTNVESTDGRITAVETAVEGTEKDLDDYKRSADQRIGTAQQTAQQASSVGSQALDKAKSAERGKLIWSVTMSDDKLRFPFGQAALSDDAQVMLNDLVSKVKSYGKALYIEVEGHTDNVGDEQWNLALSEKRAEVVRNYLNQQGGIPLHAMNTIALGETHPVADNDSRDGRAANRRVVIRVLE